jgi:hypothetical protein
MKLVGVSYAAHCISIALQPDGKVSSVGSPQGWACGLRWDGKNFVKCYLFFTSMTRFPFLGFIAKCAPTAGQDPNNILHTFCAVLFQFLIVSKRD